jgi:acetyl-CoA synthetase
MLPHGTSYREIRERFRWQVPRRYNMGVDVSDKWAGDEARLALIDRRADGTVGRYAFRDLARLSNRFANALATAAPWPW